MKIEKQINTEKYSGLTEREARARLRLFGENKILRETRFRPLVAFAEKFKSPLLLVLIATAVVSLILKQTANAAIVLVMVFLSGLMDFINSYRSQKAVEKLTSKILTTAAVVRNSIEREVAISKIVPGDVLLLSAGDIVPADCEILEARDLYVNQAALTGESYPVEKFAEEELAAGNEDQAKLYMGTSVVTGYGIARVVLTGQKTKYGEIARRLSEKPPETDFEKGIAAFSLFIVKITFVLVSFAFLANLFMGRHFLDSFMFGIAIAVGLTPELLPVIVSLSLSHGSLLMAKKEVIVKHLPAIQSIGSMNILCTDKTGTLTEDRITLVKHIDSFGHNSNEVLIYSYLTSVLHTGLVSPLDEAIKRFHHFDVKDFQKIDEIPFDYKRRRSSMVVSKSSKRFLICKGVPEEILKICDFYAEGKKRFELTQRNRQRILRKFEELSQEGLRVLGVAARTVREARSYSGEWESKMMFLGFVAFLDPPKNDAAEAVAALEKLGVEVKILTGDSEILTRKICQEIKIPIRGLLTGKELDQLNDQRLGGRLKTTTVFARISPEQKERIIRILKQDGQSVGYLGDGINDAPALHAADVGISVNNAVDVAKETADVILVRKSLRVLRDGVVEGRKTFQNTMKYIQMGLSSNFGNMLSLSFMPLFLNFLPFLPSQILFNNFLYDVSQVSLSTDRVDKRDIQKPPKWNLPAVRRFMLFFGPASSIFDFLTVGILILIFHATQAQFQASWFMESLATQVLVIYIIRTKKIPFLQSYPSLWLVLNTILAVGIGWAVPYLALGRWFHFAPPPAGAVIAICLIVAAYLVFVEFVKRRFYARSKS